SLRNESSFPTRRSSDLVGRYEFIRVEKAFPVTVLCGTLRVSRAASFPRTALARSITRRSNHRTTTEPVAILFHFTRARAPRETRDRKSTRLNSSHAKKS